MSTDTTGGIPADPSTAGTTPSAPATGSAVHLPGHTGADLHRRASVLRALHRSGTPLLLPNVWDAASARQVEAAGFPAVATSSGAVAEALGFEDHERTPPGEMLAAAARIVRAVGVPVTVDMERGYGMRPAELVERLAETGAAGCNLEDSDPRTGALLDPDEQSAFLAEVRAAADAAGTGLVVNARIDVYLVGGGTAAERHAETCRRARRYLAAGADCVYPILLDDVQAVRALVREAGGPVNVLCRPGSPSAADFAAAGTARISFGSGLFQAVRAHLAGLVGAVRAGRDPYAPGD